MIKPGESKTFFCSVDPGPVQIFVTRMLTRDLFAVDNLLAFTVCYLVTFIEVCNMFQYHAVRNVSVCK